MVIYSQHYHPDLHTTSSPPTASGPRQLSGSGAYRSASAADYSFEAITHAKKEYEDMNGRVEAMVTACMPARLRVQCKHEQNPARESVRKPPQTTLHLRCVPSQEEQASTHASARFCIRARVLAPSLLFAWLYASRCGRRVVILIACVVRACMTARRL